MARSMAIPAAKKRVNQWILKGHDFSHATGVSISVITRSPRRPRDLLFLPASTLRLLSFPFTRISSAMARIEKTVFLSYRRTNFAWALAIFQDLTQHGYDVFFDFTGLPSGDFETVILENIRARAHFLVLLTPSALERCGDPGDWLRREIDAALDNKRNIIPLMLEGFDFGTPAIATQLTGKLALLNHYHALEIRPAFVFEAMSQLRQRYLNVALDAVPHPASLVAQQAATEQKDAAATAPQVSEEELTAQQWLERGISATDPNEKLRFYSEAIRLRGDYALAFVARGLVREGLGDFDAALQDYDEGIRLAPSYAHAFVGRALVHHSKNDIEAGLKDCTEAIRLRPDLKRAFAVRGILRRENGDLDGALEDFSEAIRLAPESPDTFVLRSDLRREKGDLEGALEDCNEAILKPDFAGALNSRGMARHDKDDLHGALADFNEAIRLKPDFAVAARNGDIVRKAIADRSKS
jgi:tetratricopeptide (TPR) repeat protein